MDKPHVVIVGGGFCGVSCARRLRGRADVTIVSARPYFEFTPAVPRVLTDGGVKDSIRIPLQEALPKAQVVVGTCSRITPDTVFVGQQRIGFDYLVICRGVEYPVPLRDASRVFTVKDGQDALAAAPVLEVSRRVLIVGGGLIGTELAGELCTKMECEVTIVHPRESLIERNPSRASMAALRFLRKRGVKVVFGEKVVGRAGEHFLTDKNRTVDADICFWCAGIKSDAGFLSEAFAGVVTEQKTVAVNECLQVVGFPNVFAGGDVTNVQEEKTAQNAERHGHVIAGNIIRHAGEKPLARYHGHVGPLVISLGDWYGLFVWKGFVWSGVLPGLLKRAIEWWCLFSTRYL